MPRYEDLDWDGLNVTRETYEKLATVDAKAWQKEVKDHRKFFDSLKSRLPSEMEDKRQELEKAVS
jgi:phosphoenolpyruvate carboxykinase (GTP)